MDIYKSISQHPSIFKKEKIDYLRKKVSLIRGPRQGNHDTALKYSWNELREILKRELNPIFKSNIQPSYSISMDNSLDIFFKILTINTNNNCPEFSGLADRILPTLYKFYVGASDRNDKLNFLKQIVTSQEVYFKKLLYLVNDTQYVNIKRRNEGFGTVLDQLTNIDPQKNRYKSIRQASNYEFGKHCSRAYKIRNLDTHNANDWNEFQLLTSKTSCLVFMVYAAFEYYNELNSI